MTFANIKLLPYLIAGFILLLTVLLMKNINFKKINFSNFLSLEKINQKITNFYWLVDVLKIAGIIFLIIAVLRPQEIKRETTEKIKGIDIIIALDVSGSMQADDLLPNRLEAAKEVCKWFINGLKSDRVGLVVFAGKSFTQCPLTIDYQIIKNFIDQINFQTVRIDGTAVGDAILNAINRLENSKASKVVILTTDGVSNTGFSPIEAAKMAAYKNIKIYTIGIGKKGGAPMIRYDSFGRKVQVYDRWTGQPLKWEEPDEKTLMQIADLTGGKYFRAIDEKKLKEIYDLIAKMEKQDIDVKTYNRYEDKFYIFLIFGFLLLFFALLIEIFKFTRIIA